LSFIAKLPKELTENLQQNMANLEIEIANLKLENFTIVLKASLIGY
jgi:hypothetical protein